ncbi:TetR/AcrR family transcriptional regulator [Actinoallomurus purpureus]|uniref:TetR/AcrR family transcriptional regulator n=1 Tax=Actinoallomurus purpureus TaxID=478114 RepID=UPI0020924069|nr:TetR/AcrR family transcriptional regulator [Actinoallomurus purpureus]MCO6005631.1 TetR/AcrR family transcriptional regulator [Actinoallomurus purpureus]
MGEHRGDTRARIQAVALELFAEQGYEKTSLREIAERLNVTKAALYYHFKTKEDIIVSLFDDALARLDDLIAWGREQPATLETRQELVRRYADQLYGSGPGIMRFAQENQGTMRDLAVGEKLRCRVKDLIELLADRKAPLTEQLKSAMAVFTLNAALFTFRDYDITEEERRATGIAVALELISGSSHAES